MLNCIFCPFPLEGPAGKWIQRYMEWSKTTQFAQKYGGKRCENTFTMATCTQTVACICLTLGWFVRMLFGTSRTGLWCARKVNFQSTVRAHRLRTHIPEDMIEKGWPGICTFMIRYKGTGSSTTDGSSLEKKTFPFIYLFICIYLFEIFWVKSDFCLHI